MVLKVDMEQAYDKMNWKTIQVVMKAMVNGQLEFPDPFIQWVSECVQDPRFALLVNGQKTKWINAKCGFRQSCLLSSHLFILCSELLSMAIHQRGNNIGVQIAK